jgi:tetratricopeptide (TPR) repeat protein
VIAVVLSLLVAQGAPLPDEVRVKDVIARAGKEYATGQFDKALGDYREAYRLKPSPGLLFNLGQTAKQMRDYRQSAFYFSQYLGKTEAVDPNRPKAEALLEEMQLKADEEEAKAEKLRSMPKVVLQGEPGGKFKIIGYSMLGGAALALIAGSIEGLHYRHLNSALDARYRSQGAYSQHDAAIYSDASTSGHIANGLFIAAAVFAAAGAVLVYRF